MNTENTKLFFKNTIKFLLFFVPGLIILILLVANLNSSPDNMHRLCINEIMADNFGSLPDSNGVYNDWIELYNGTNEDINLAGFGLSNDLNSPFKYIFPDITIEAGKYLVIYAGSSTDISVTTNDSSYDSSSADSAQDKISLYTEFALDVTAGQIILTSPDGAVADSLEYGPQSRDVSYGRSPLDYYSLVYFSNASPGSRNPLILKVSDGTSSQSIAFSLPSGEYSEAISLDLLVINPNSFLEDGTILYTLDGSIPNLKSPIYKKPIEITDNDGNGTVVRARIYSNNTLGDVYTSTYFIHPNPDAYKIVALTVDPLDMFGPEGLYVSGQIGNLFRLRGQDNPYAGNYILTDTVACNIEMLEKSGVNSDTFTSQGKIKIRGQGSRTIMQKTFSVNMDKAYAFNNFNKTTGLKIRATGVGEPYEYSKIDAYIESLCQDLDLGCPEIELANLYINGEYWGLYAIQEDSDSSFWMNHYGLQEGQLISITNQNLNLLDSFKKAAMINHGSANDFNDYKDFCYEITSKDFTNPEDYDWLSSRLDIQQFIDYMIVESFFCNTDWPDNNVEVWKSRDEDSKWRFRLYDMDKCLEPENLHMSISEPFDEFNLDDDPVKFFVGILFNKLMENEDFKLQYYKRYQDILNNIFTEENLINKYDSLYDELCLEMDRNLDKVNSGYYQARLLPTNFLSYEQWQENMLELRQNIIDRRKYVADQLK